MFLDIKPLHNKAWSCLEDIIISAVYWWGYRYEMMFSEAWNFQYICDSDKKKSGIGNNLHEGYDNTWELLEKYHGICIIATGMLDASSIYDIICAELRNSCPTILYINAYNCPWIAVYHESHFPHTCLVIGNDEKNKSFICIDPYTTSKNQVLPYSDFYEGSTQCAIFRNRYRRDPQIDWKGVLNQTVDNFLYSTYLDNPISNMLVFADEIEQRLNLDDEIGENDDLLKIPLLRDLNIWEDVEYSILRCYIISMKDTTYLI